MYFDRIIIETDEDEPKTIAEITPYEINLADGYRLHARPEYSTEEKVKAFVDLAKGGFHASDLTR